MRKMLCLFVLLTIFICVQNALAVPEFSQVLFSDHVLTAETPLSITLTVTEKADLSVTILDGDKRYPLTEGTMTSPTATLQWKGTVDGGQMLPTGDYTVELVLLDSETGEKLTIEHYDVTLADSSPINAQTQIDFTPAYQSPYTCDHENCYWHTKMDVNDEAAVWAMLMSPITIVDGDQRDQVFLYEQPDESSKPVADVTCYSQGVHVIEKSENGWSLVETYSSSFHKSTVAAYNQFVQGYIKTNLLKEVTPGNKEYGIVVDKLTQKLYIYHDGRLFSTLLCSTGTIGKDKKLFNETRSGDFLLVSPMGEFASEELMCSYGMRFNDGDALHEVPHLINADGSFNYKKTEPYLGSRASHGCVRVQRVMNPEGVNMRWIWNTLYKNLASKHVRFVIWEDFKGRQLEVPDDDMPLYYNAKNGANYHCHPECKGVNAKYLPMATFTYKELDDSPYSKLKSCPNCAPPKRIADIEEINESYRLD